MSSSTTFAISPDHWKRLTRMFEGTSRPGRPYRSFIARCHSSHSMCDETVAGAVNAIVSELYDDSVALGQKRAQMQREIRALKAGDPTEVSTFAAEAWLSKQGKPDNPWLNVALLFASSGLTFPEHLTTQSLLAKATAAVSELERTILTSNKTPEMK
eukprot:2486642-Amphidinium_carterae.1